MSRIELDTIQAKLKAAILKHKTMVARMKGDSQNSVSLKKGLADVQEEIKRLAEEQKKIVVSLRECYVKTSSSSPALTPVGQPQLVSFSTQGGNPILPVSVLAVPIAHVQPTVNMFIHTSSTGGQPAGISLMPANLLNSGCSILNSCGSLNIANNLGSLLHGNITLSGLDNTQLTAAPSDHGLNNVIREVNGGDVVGSNNNTLMSNGNILLANLSSLVTANGHSVVSTSCEVKTQPSAIMTSCGTPISSQNAGISHFNLTVTPLPTVSQAPASVASQQPLVQQHLLQQQQQQILQMIHQQQPHQRLASHLPIKVPQYTASHIRPGSNSAPVHNGSLLTAPVTAAHIVKVATSISVPAFPKAVSHLPTTAQGHSNSHLLVSSSATSTKTFLPAQKCLPQQTVQETATSNAVAVTQMLSLEEEKILFLKKLGLFTSSALNELMKKKNERKRRKTANPHYSFGFELSRRNDSEWGTSIVKKARVPGKVASSADKKSLQKQVAAKKMSDNHDDYCAVCNNGGQLLMCETCRLVYHLDCLNPPLVEAPKYAWSCPKCLVSGKGLNHINSEVLSKVQSYITFKEAKLKEKKNMDEKNEELMSEKYQLERKLKHLEVKIKEETDLHLTLTSKETKKKEELEKLSNFVRAMKDSCSSESSASN